MSELSMLFSISRDEFEPPALDTYFLPQVGIFVWCSDPDEKYSIESLLYQMC